MALPVLDVRINGKSVSLPESDSRTAKKAVLQRYVSERAYDPFHRRLVNHLGKLALLDGRGFAYSDEIARAVRGASGKPITPHSVTQSIKSVRHSLDRFNTSPEQIASPYRLYLDTESPMNWVKGSGRKQPYKLAFVSQRNAHPAVALWKRMIAGKDRHVALLYDTDDVKSKEPSFDLPGQFAGSGLVAAAAYVTQVIARIEPPHGVHPVRYCDLGSAMHNELAERCQIVLGPASSPFFLQNIKGNPELRGYQMFTFAKAVLKPRQGERHTLVINRHVTRDYPKTRVGTIVATGGMKKRYEHAVISYYICPDQTFVALQGVSSAATMAAAMLMWDDRIAWALKKLFRLKGIDSEKDLPSFELLIGVEVCEGETIRAVDILELVPHTEVNKSRFNSSYRY